jgi:hypothetical protein
MVLNHIGEHLFMQPRWMQGKGAVFGVCVKGGSECFTSPPSKNPEIGNFLIFLILTSNLVFFFFFFFLVFLAQMEQASLRKRTGVQIHREDTDPAEAGQGQ